MQRKPRILFVCGRNRWRSPTAEHLYRHDRRIEVRSAGISASSRHTISSADVGWADLILVMESRYATRIVSSFRGQRLPPIKSLDIPDDYGFMQAELVELIRGAVEFHLRELARADQDD